MRISRSLVCSGFEVVVSKSSASSFYQYPFFARFEKFEQHFSGFRIFRYRTYRDIQVNVLSVFTLAQLSASCTSMFSLDVLAVFQMDKSPELWIRPEDDMSSSSTVTSVRSSLRYIFGSVQMCRTCTSVSGSTVYLHIVYEIAVWHMSLSINILSISSVSMIG